jgi:hypothetical protein
MPTEDGRRPICWSKPCPRTKRPGYIGIGERQAHHFGNHLHRNRETGLLTNRHEMASVTRVFPHLLPLATTCLFGERAPIRLERAWRESVVMAWLAVLVSTSKRGRLRRNMMKRLRVMESAKCLKPTATKQGERLPIPGVGRISCCDRGAVLVEIYWPIGNPLTRSTCT